MKYNSILLLAFALGLFMFPVVYADGEVDLSSFPSQLADKLNIELFPAQLLSTAIFLCLFLFPALLLGGKQNAIFSTLIIGIIVVGFAIAMGWLSFWFLIIIVFAVAGLFSAKMKDVFT